MITKRIIPCLDVKNNKVVKGVQFKNHQIVGSIMSLAESIQMMELMSWYSMTFLQA